ncbi:hypothetical protein, partial [Dokdonella sp.]|uniref:hypothetical protein n=1 Tax=Dokdonella sp. TaxID=2291710 RepID=UPI003C3A19E8
MRKSYHLWLASLTLLFLSGGTCAVGVEDGFSATVDNGTARALAVQGDGKILVGGGFTSINGQPREKIARVHANGSFDASFVGALVESTGSAQVLATAVQVDGKILIAGFFSQVGGLPRKGIARLNPDGSLDASYNPVLDGNGVGRVLNLQPDGKLIIGGSFSSVSGFARANLARLNSDGSVDTSYAAGVGGISSVESAALQPDGRLIVTGGNNGAMFIRLNPDGSPDATFQATSGGYVFGLAIQPDGKIFAAGEESFRRINADGSDDLSFVANLDSDVNAIALQSDGKIIASGSFTMANGQVRNGIARFDTSGNLDATYDPDVQTSVSASALQADGKLVVAGGFSNIGGHPAFRIARLNIDGSVDATLNPGTNSTVNALAQQANGKLLVGGAFTSL